MAPASVLLVGAAITLRQGEFSTGWFFRGPFRFVVADDRTFGAPYDTYRQAVRCWIPRRQAS
jgi:hypothetical protein